MCSTEKHYKLPNGLIDACVVYGLGRKHCEDLQSRYFKCAVSSAAMFIN